MDQKAVTDSELCAKHGIAVYVVADVYSADENGEAIPIDELRMWFVSAFADSVHAEKVADIPLAQTSAEAERLAVKHLALS